MYRVLTRLDESGTLRPGRDIDIETERLTSLLDGLCLNAVPAGRLPCGSGRRTTLAPFLGSVPGYPYLTRRTGP